MSLPRLSFLGAIALFLSLSFVLAEDAKPAGDATPPPGASNGQPAPQPQAVCAGCEEYKKYGLPMCPHCAAHAAAAAGQCPRCAACAAHRAYHQAKAKATEAAEAARPKGWIGLGIDSHTAAVMVTEVTAGSPGAAAGIQPGDQVVLLDGWGVFDGCDLTEKVRSHSPGDKIILTVIRNYQWIGLQVTLGAAPAAAEPQPQPGQPNPGVQPNPGEQPNAEPPKVPETPKEPAKPVEPEKPKEGEEPPPPVPDEPK